jgi:hypothetical protein
VQASAPAGIQRPLHALAFEYHVLRRLVQRFIILFALVCARMAPNLFQGVGAFPNH